MVKVKTPSKGWWPGPKTTLLKQEETSSMSRRKSCNWASIELKTCLKNLEWSSMWWLTRTLILILKMKNFLLSRRLVWHRVKRKRPRNLKVISLEMLFLISQSAVMSSTMLLLTIWTCTSKGLIESSFRWSSRECRWPVCSPRLSSCWVLVDWVTSSSFKQLSERSSFRRNSLFRSSKVVRKYTFQTSWVLTHILDVSVTTTPLFKLLTVCSIGTTKFTTLLRLNSIWIRSRDLTRPKTL